MNLRIPVLHVEPNLARARSAREERRRQNFSIKHVGKHHDDTTKHKISVAASGENNGHWKGGISFEPYCPKFNDELRTRVRAFFDCRCVICGTLEQENGRKLSVHHVEYNKSACCDGEPVHFAALCSRCHPRTNSDRTRWESMLHHIIDEIYDGRSYFTKEEFWGRASA
jgi:hypothetical protein